VEKSQLLDNLSELKKRDRNGMLDILARFDQFLKTSLENAPQIEIPQRDRIDGVILVGLGGSAIGGDLARAYLGSDLKVPFQVVRSYTIPGWVNRSTLALVSSYSGNTEETLAALQAVKAAGAPVVCMTSGGELERTAARDGQPVFKFPEGFPPRTALPFSFVAIVSALAQAGLISDRTAELDASLPWIRHRLEVYGPENPQRDNPAKTLATRLFGRVPVIYGSSQRLAYVARRWAAQISENAKELAYFSELPEMNHNEIVGWQHPAEMLRRLVPIFLRDQQDHPRVQLRLEITREFLGRRTEPVLEYWSAGEPWLERLWTLILLGDFASVYLSFLNREDPTPVETIESLKVRLRQY
jgi:glucose/mannose-6-phosphate isomerase